MLLVSFFQLNEIFPWKNCSMDIFQSVLAGIFAVQPGGRKFCRTTEQSRAREPRRSQRLELQLLHSLLNCPSVGSSGAFRGKSQGQIPAWGTPRASCVPWGLSAGWVIPGGEMLCGGMGAQGAGTEQEGPFSTLGCGSAAPPCTAARADLILCSCPESFGDDKRKNSGFINSRSWRCLNFPR